MDHDPRASDASPESSIELIRRARGGDRRALDQLFQRYVPPLRRWASGRLPRWARQMVDSDDIIQETLIKTMTHLDAFEVRHDGALQAYMRQALRNRIVDEVRRVGRRPQAEPVSEHRPHPGASPLEETIGAEAVERYETALGRLSESEREAIVARIELGFDYDQIARALDKPSRDAARMAVSRALVRLAQEMGHE
jgi:RNA polymerase sigma-70 factor (ECF subfamily)